MIGGTAIYDFYMPGITGYHCEFGIVPETQRKGIRADHSFRLKLEYMANVL